MLFCNRCQVVIPFSFTHKTIRACFQRSHLFCHEGEQAARFRRCCFFYDKSERVVSFLCKIWWVNASSDSEKLFFPKIEGFCLKSGIEICLPRGRDGSNVASTRGLTLSIFKWTPSKETLILPSSVNLLFGNNLWFLFSLYKDLRTIPHLPQAFRCHCILSN